MTRALRLCQIRECFLDEWRRDYPCVPAPDLCHLECVCESDVIDESQRNRHVASISRSLNAVHNKIGQLREQVQRKVRLRHFFIDTLDEFDEAEGEKWRAVVVRGESPTVGSSSSWSLAVDVNKTWLGSATDQSGPCFGCQNHNPTSPASTHDTIIADQGVLLFNSNQTGNDSRVVSGSRSNSNQSGARSSPVVSDEVTGSDLQQSSSPSPLSSSPPSSSSSSLAPSVPVENSPTRPDPHRPTAVFLSQKLASRDDGNNVDGDSESRQEPKVAGKARDRRGRTCTCTGSGGLASTIPTLQRQQRQRQQQRRQQDRRQPDRVTDLKDRKPFHDSGSETRCDKNIHSFSKRSCFCSESDFLCDCVKCKSNSRPFPVTLCSHVGIQCDLLSTVEWPCCSTSLESSCARGNDDDDDNDDNEDDRCDVKAKTTSLDGEDKTSKVSVSVSVKSDSLADNNNSRLRGSGPGNGPSALGVRLNQENLLEDHEGSYDNNNISNDISNTTTNNNINNINNTDHCDDDFNSITVIHCRPESRSRPNQAAGSSCSSNREEEEEEEEEGSEMFRPKKSASGSKGSGSKGKSGSDRDGSGSPSGRRGSKDNFLAVTSKRRVSLEEEAGKTLVVRDTSTSPSRSPLLARNFQMLRLTPGFDLVLGGDGRDGAGRDGQRGDNSAVRDRDALSVTQSQSDCSKNSIALRQAPPFSADVTRSPVLNRINNSNNNRRSSNEDISRGKDFDKEEQPDLIKSVSKINARTTSEINARTTSEINARTTSVSDNKNSRCDFLEEGKKGEIMKGNNIVVTSRTENDDNSRGGDMPALERTDSLSPLPSLRRDSSKKTPPPVPAKPRHGSVGKKGSLPSLPPSSKPPVDKEDKGRQEEERGGRDREDRGGREEADKRSSGLACEYSESDLLEGLLSDDDDETSSSTTTGGSGMHASQTSLSSLDSLRSRSSTGTKSSACANDIIVPPPSSSPSSSSYNPSPHIPIPRADGGKPDNDVIAIANSSSPSSSRPGTTSGSRDVMARSSRDPSPSSSSWLSSSPSKATDIKSMVSTVCLPLPNAADAIHGDEKDADKRSMATDIKSMLSTFCVPLPNATNAVCLDESGADRKSTFFVDGDKAEEDSGRRNSKFYVDLDVLPSPSSYKTRDPLSLPCPGGSGGSGNPASTRIGGGVAVGDSRDAPPRTDTAKDNESKSQDTFGDNSTPTAAPEHPPPLPRRGNEDGSGGDRRTSGLDGASRRESGTERSSLAEKGNSHAREQHTALERLDEGKARGGKSESTHEDNPEVKRRPRELGEKNNKQAEEEEEDEKDLVVGKSVNQFSSSVEAVTVNEENKADSHAGNAVLSLRQEKGRVEGENVSSVSSDTSVETLVDDNHPHPHHQQQQHQQYQEDVKLRSVSCISDADVRAAISAFDLVFSSSDDLEDSNCNPSSNPANKPTSASLSAMTSRDDDDNAFISGDGGGALASSRKRRSSTPNYVNWTINRALTSSIHSRDLGLSVSEDMPSFDDDDDDDDEEEDVAMDSSSRGLDRLSGCHANSVHIGSHGGSKDSGLCEDSVSMSDSAHLDLDLGRITDLRQIQEMARCEEEEEEEAARQEGRGFGLGLGGGVLIGEAMDKDADSVSVTSDIVFLPNTPDTHHRLVRQDPLDEDDDEDDDGDDGDIETDQGDESQNTLRPDKVDTRSLNSINSSLGDDSETGCGNTSYDEIDNAREGMLKMRQLLVKGVLESEKTFLGILDVLIKYKKLLQASSQSSQAVISQEDITAIFGNIESLHAIHLDFVTALEAKVTHWTHTECIGGIFKELVVKFSEFVAYVNNYPNAVTAIHRCGQENEQFHDVAKRFKMVNSKEVSSLEDALFKPVQRVQRNTLVLHDLIKHTPEDHEDYDALQKALKLSQHNLENYQAVAPPTSISHENKRLVKNSFLVEYVKSERKLRYMFLFNDILVCTKRETHRNKRVTFVIKWFAHLAATSFDTKFEYNDDAKFSNPEEIEKLKVNIREVKRELKAEMRKFDDKDKHKSLVNLGGGTRAMEKLRKKLNQYEGQLILSSPKLPFKVSLEGGKEYTLLMTTDYEREEWREALQFLCKKCSKGDQPASSISVQDLINSVKETPQVNKIGNVLLKCDEDALMGTLNVNIHKMNGLTKECDTYCCLEMDSFGHFSMMAKTNVVQGSKDPTWNEDFELELDGSQTLRILCFKKGWEGAGDILLGRGALELDRQWLKGSFQEKSVSMNEISLVISVRHIAPEKTMQRTPSRVINACFGVKISSSARREGKMVPTIITACIQEVEKRGLDEVGIYRVSGVSSDLKRIKKLFDKNIKVGAEALKDVDIHAVTGILKMYLRELPEPIFTDTLYQNFVDTLKFSDEEAKAQCLLSLYHSLPDANYYASVCILEHLVNVAHNVGKNKMSINNLATVFGPTLLAPAAKETTADPMELMFKGTEEVMQQSSLINYILGLAVSGRSLRKSAQ